MPSNTSQLALIETAEDVPARLSTALGVVVALGVGLYIGAAAFATLFAALVLAAVVARKTYRTAARALPGLLRHRARARRRRWRNRQLAAYGLPRDGLLELLQLVERVERQDPAMAARFDLDELLDRHVRLSVARARCLGAMRMADRDQLAIARDARLAAGDTRRAAMLSHRIRSWDHAAAQAARCADELATLLDLVHLLGQRATCPEISFDDDSLDRHLTDLDAEDQAMGQLAAGNG